MLPFDFDLPQFTTKEVLECVPGLNPETYKQWHKRGEVLLRAADEMGPGKRVQHTAVDVIQVAARYVLIPHGQFVAKFRIIWDVINGRIIARKTGSIAFDPGPISVLFFLHPVSGDLHMNAFDESAGVNFSALADPAIPTLQLMFGIDRFIDRMVEQMQHVKAGTKSKSPPTARQPLPREFDYDDKGNVVLAGLTQSESVRYVDMREMLENRHQFSDETEKNAFHAECRLLDRKHALTVARKISNKADETRENDEMRRWSKDSEGNFILVGLTKSETEEYQEYFIKDYAESIAKYMIWESLDEKDAARDRYLELNEKHENERRRLIADEIRQRAAEEESRKPKTDGKKSAWRLWR